MTQLSETQEAHLERQCIHRLDGAAGQIYAGASYVAALQRLRGEQAQRMTRKVEAFFWQDAPQVTVWLCRDCAIEMGLDK